MRPLLKEKNGKNTNLNEYAMLQKIMNAPMFVVVPDVVGDFNETLREWDRWTTSGWLIEYGFELAFVAQDGCTPDDVPDNADWVFIGGTPDWKTGNIYRFCKAHPKVHVGGVNTGRKLWISHKCVVQNHAMVRGGLEATLSNGFNYDNIYIVLNTDWATDSRCFLTYTKPIQWVRSSIRKQSRKLKTD